MFSCLQSPFPFMIWINFKHWWVSPGQEGSTVLRSGGKVWGTCSPELQHLQKATKEFVILHETLECCHHHSSTDYWSGGTWVVTEGHWFLELWGSLFCLVCCSHSVLLWTPFSRNQLKIHFLRETIATPQNYNDIFHKLRGHEKSLPLLLKLCITPQGVCMHKIR